MPAWGFGHLLQCWQDGGRKACRKSAQFKARVAEPAPAGRSHEPLPVARLRSSLFVPGFVVSIFQSLPKAFRPKPDAAIERPSLGLPGRWSAEHERVR